MPDLLNLKLSRQLNSIKLPRTVDRNSVVATGWTVRGDILHTCPYRTWGPPSLLYNGVKRPECGADHPPHSAPRLNKEVNYTSTPLPVFMAGSTVNFTSSG